MDALSISGPGLLLVQSRISRPDLLDEKTFMHWYDDDHIAEILQTSGIRTARRWKHDDIDRGTPLPYLSLYPLADIAFLTTDEFKTISVTSALLPGSGLCYDLADFHVVYYNLVQATAARAGAAAPQSLVVEQVEVEAEGAEAEGALDGLYQNYLPAVSSCPGYIRTLRFVLRFSRSNDESRQFKGLAGSGTVAAKRPTWLALHEFSTVEVDLAAPDVAAAVATIKSQATVFQQDVFHMAKFHGGGFFDE